MVLSRRSLLGTVAATATLPTSRAQALPPTIKLGVLTDMSGTARDTVGMKSVAGVRQAVREFTAAGGGLTTEVIFADHQNKADVAASIARQWLDQEGVDIVIDVPNSAAALAVQTIVRDRNKVFIPVASGSTALTGAQCSPNCLHWVYDTHMLAAVEGSSIVAAGGDRWFFIMPDYAFGHSLVDEATAVVRKAGGTVLGAVAYPFPETTDFAAYLLQAKAAGANVIGLGNFGVDLVNCMKQAGEFGLRKDIRMAALIAVAIYVHATGLETMQGLLIPQSYYWDLNDRTRAFARRAMADGPEAAASEFHAGCYAGALHYLKAANDLGAAAAKADGRAVVNRMKAMPFDDDAFGTGTIRADGRVMVTSYLFQVKTPAESSGPWDLFKPLATVPPEQAFRSLAEGGCPFIKV